MVLFPDIKKCSLGSQDVLEGVIHFQDLKRFKTPTPPPPPSPKEEAKPDKFTVVQLLALHEQVGITNLLCHFVGLNYHP